MKAMKTIKSCCALFGAVAVLTAPNVFATIGTITLTEDYGNANGGGAFTAVTTGGLGTFDTFCLQENVLFHPGNTYDYSTSSTVLPGGNAIAIGTAYLYSQFRLGTLSGYTYGSAASANALQAAIWYLQGQNFGANNTFVTLAETALGLNGTTIFNAADGADGVFAINLTDPNNNYYQPQLGWSAVPEPSTVVAGALLLLPFGVSTMRILRKNKTS
jgi:hypothetical protein